MAVAPGIIDQETTAGGLWDGTVPPGVPVNAQGIRTFPPAATGGRFELPWGGVASSFETYVVDKIMVDFGLSAVNQVAIVDVGGRIFVLATPPAGPYLYLGPLELAWDERIEITSAASANAMHARVHGRPGRTRPVVF